MPLPVSLLPLLSSPPPPLLLLLLPLLFSVALLHPLLFIESARHDVRLHLCYDHVSTQKICRKSISRSGTCVINKEPKNYCGHTIKGKLIRLRDSRGNHSWQRCMTSGNNGRVAMTCSMDGVCDNISLRTRDVVPKRQPTKV